MDQLDIKEWGLSDPPYYIVYRGGEAGSALTAPPRAPEQPGVEETVGMVFSSREMAEKFIRRNGMNIDRWRVGELPSWRHIVGFLESYPVLTYVSPDPDDLESPRSCVVVDISILLPVLRELALRDAPAPVEEPGPAAIEGDRRRKE